MKENTVQNHITYIWSPDLQQSNEEEEKGTKIIEYEIEGKNIHWPLFHNTKNKFQLDHRTKCESNKASKR